MKLKKKLKTQNDRVFFCCHQTGILHRFCKRFPVPSQTRLHSLHWHKNMARHFNSSEISVPYLCFLGVARYIFCTGKTEGILGTRARNNRGAEYISGGVFGTPNIGAVSLIWSAVPIFVRV